MTEEATDLAPAEQPLPGLTILQSRFVRAMASGEHDSAAAAARHAGYALTHAADAACHNMRNGAIQEAIQAATLTHIAEHAPRALASMARLATGAKSEMVRQVASKDLLDRAGYKPPDRHMVAVGGVVDVDIRMGD